MKNLIKKLAYEVWIGSSIIGLILVVLGKAICNPHLLIIGLSLSIIAGCYVSFLVLIALIMNAVMNRIEKARKRRAIMVRHYLRVEIDALKAEVERLQGVA